MAERLDFVKLHPEVFHVPATQEERDAIRKEFYRPRTPFEKVILEERAKRVVDDVFGFAGIFTILLVAYNLPSWFGYKGN
jgi:hypothetical protein